MPAQTVVVYVMFLRIVDFRNPRLHGFNEYWEWTKTIFILRATIYTCKRYNGIVKKPANELLRI